jgi:hypothetical protein
MSLFMDNMKIKVDETKMIRKKIKSNQYQTGQNCHTCYAKTVKEHWNALNDTAKQIFPPLESATHASWKWRSDYTCINNFFVFIFILYIKRQHYPHDQIVIAKKPLWNDELASVTMLWDFFYVNGNRVITLCLRKLKTKNAPNHSLVFFFLPRVFK